ncbi:MAG TPA: MEDS domain-containing protein [Pseudonocardiaceae bacterium]
MIEDRHGDVRGPDPGEPATSVSRVHSGKRRTNGYVMLDSTWARQLGVRRSGGVYRIGRRKLMERLKELQQIPTQGGGDLTANVELHSHFVEFYETEKFLVDSVLDFLAPGLRAGDAAIVVANEAHRHSVDSALMAAGIDLPQARGCGRYIALDASEALGTFMVGGRPDAARFKIAIGQLVSGAVESAPNVRIYGEMVAVLWDEGNVAAAITLEDLWNDLGTRYPFSLFCAYPMRAFDTDVSTEGYRTICGQHSTVLLQDQGT